MAELHGARRSDPPRRSSQPKPQLGERQERLKVFHGHWEGRGRTASGGCMEVIEDFHWMDGGFFLESRFDQEVEGRRHRGLSLLGWDGGRETYVLQMADNLGYCRSYALTNHGAIWRLEGPFERAVYTFSGDGESLTERWETSADGVSFEPLCEFTVRRRR